MYIVDTVTNVLINARPNSNTSNVPGLIRFPWSRKRNWIKTLRTGHKLWLNSNFWNFFTNFPFAAWVFGRNELNQVWEFSKWQNSRLAGEKNLGSAHSEGEENTFYHIKRSKSCNPFRASVSAWMRSLMGVGSWTRGWYSVMAKRLASESLGFVFWRASFLFVGVPLTPEWIYTPGG